MNLNKPFEVEMKGLIDVLINNTRELFSIKPFKANIEKVLAEEYIRGIETVDKQIKPSVNTILPSNVTKQLEGLYNYVEQNLQDHVDDIGSRLRQELQRGLQNNETKQQIIARVSKVFREDGDVINRLKMVVRTETNRANNTGRLEAANQAERAGVEVFKWVSVHPYQKGRSSLFCITPGGRGKNSAHGKYGTPEQGISLEKSFIVKDKNKTVTSMAPPFHVNCRSVLRIGRVK